MEERDHIFVSVGIQMMDMIATMSTRLQRTATRDYNRLLTVKDGGVLTMADEMTYKSVSKMEETTLGIYRWSFTRGMFNFSLL
jgi:hypothetical protein